MLIASVDPHGFSLEYDPGSEVQKSMHEDIVTGRTYEPGTWETFHRILRPGDHYIDVGAHVGTFACLAAALVGPTGYVVAFEPDKKNFCGLGANRKRNGFEWMRTLPMAVSDKGGRIILYHCADNDGGHAIYDPGLQRGNAMTRAKPSKRSVLTMALDDIESEVYARLIKIDVEGAECSVLRGAEKYIDRCRPAIIAENNAVGLAHMGESQFTMREIVRRHGYREYGIQDSPPWYVPLTEHEHCQPMYWQDGKPYFVTYNMLFLPEEWPEL